MTKKIPIKTIYNEKLKNVIKTIDNFSSSYTKKTKKDEIAITKYIDAKTNLLNSKLEKIADARGGFKKKTELLSKFERSVKRYEKNLSNGNYLEKNKRDFLKTIKQVVDNEKTIEYIQMLLNYGVDINENNWRGFFNENNDDLNFAEKVLETFYSSGEWDDENADIIIPAKLTNNKRKKS